jgi:hypothetical protein
VAEKFVSMKSQIVQEKTVPRPRERKMSLVEDEVLDVRALQGLAK